MAVIDHKTEELVFLAGDRPDPLDDLAPGTPGERARSGGGMSITTRLTGTAKGHPKVRYQGGGRTFILTIDVYEFENEPTSLHLICPRCHNALRITADNKALEYDPSRNETMGGRLDVDTFECTWELPEGRRQEFGIGLCRWRVGIANNVARDA